MKRLLFYCISIISVCSCNEMGIVGSGNIITENRQTGDFKGVSVGGAFEVEIHLGATTEVKVEADDNVIKDIETEVSGGVLKISNRGEFSFSNTHMKVYITVPQLNSIKSSGASDVKILDVVKNTGKVSFDVSGAGSIKGEVDAPEVDAEISGAGNMTLSGRTKDYTGKVSGSGDLKTADLMSENTEVRVSGAGSAWVHASVLLKINASGAGNVYYKGGAKVEEHSSGASTIKKED
ncbi:MAG: head GIN domain-containing protein [Ferruginibacter sp.]